MLLFENVPVTTPAIQRLIRELVLLLPQLRVRQVPARHEDMRLFEYEQTEEFTKLLRGIFEELTQANDIKLAVETRAEMTIPKRQPNEKRPSPIIQHLDVGWLQVPPGYIAILQLLPPENCLKPVELQVTSNLKEGKTTTKHHSVILFESIYFRTEPAGIPYGSLPVPTSPLGGVRE